MPIKNVRKIPTESVALLCPYEIEAHLEAGVDEAGRGCGAGPVVAAAVILPAGFNFPGLRDSKKMSKGLRDAAAAYVKQHAVAYAWGVVDVETIDRINILEAAYLAMHHAINGLQVLPELLLIDGNRFKNQTMIPHKTVIKGDDKVMCIAAAAVLAKTYRDELMEQLAGEFPQYGWGSNKGYLTVAHRKACRVHGLTVHHRRSFSILPSAESV